MNINQKGYKILLKNQNFSCSAAAAQKVSFSLRTILNFFNGWALLLVFLKRHLDEECQ